MRTRITYVLILCAVTGKARLVLCIMSAFCCLLIGLSTLKAQAVGEITGRVTDPSGALVANVRITATRADTGVSQSTISTSAGTYTIPRLPVGTLCGGCRGAWLQDRRRE
jgi:Carboxypeptidase regulatory-like domain